jgi:hypothetical protein
LVVWIARSFVNASRCCIFPLHGVASVSNETRTAEKVLSDYRITRIKGSLRRQEAVGATDLRLRDDLILALSELQRHRRIEHDHYWGDDND